MDYKEFNDQLTRYLSKLSAADLRKVILALAEDTESSQRMTFIMQVKDVLTSQTKQQPDKLSLHNKLRKKIQILASQINDGSFAEGWGWDYDLHDEQEWGDESWAPQMDDYLRQLRKIFLDGEYTLSAELYAILLKAFDEGHEPGHLPGDPDSAYMLEEDINEHLPPDIACSLAKRLEIHFTPKHGSWLNIAEIELSAMTKQCLDRRIDNITSLQNELFIWETSRNNMQKGVDWQFTTPDARIKLKRLYPQFKP